MEVIIEEPYEFVPPHRGRRWPAFMAWISSPYLRRFYGIATNEVLHPERLSRVIDAGDGAVLIGNHSRPCDPMALGLVAHAVRRPVFCMASWHTFKNSAFERFCIRRCGAFSVYREGTDHRSLNFAVDAVTSGERPVAIFSEGCLSRSNDFVMPLLEGSALIGRMAARKRAKLEPPGRVVAVPIAFKYFFVGQVEETVLPVVRRLEQRLTWRPAENLPLLDRVRRVGDAMLALKEMQYLGAGQSGEIHTRIETLVNWLLDPLEEAYGLGVREVSGYARIQRLRSAIVPLLLAAESTTEEKKRLRGELDKIEDSLALSTYPPDYLGTNPPLERIIETVERLEEDVTGENSFQGPWHLTIDIGEPIEIEARRARGETDDLMPRLREELNRMVLAIERPRNLSGTKQ